jgi:hypothetical protein
MLQRVALISLSILGLVLLCIGGVAVGYVYLIHRYDPPSIWRNPPLYPGTQNVSVQDFGEWGKPDPNSGAISDRVYVIKIIKFTVVDQPQDVKNFYGERFAGWTLDTWGRKVQSPDRLNFSWTSGGRSPSVYFVDVITSPSNAGGTDVEVGVSMLPGY